MLWLYLHFPQLQLDTQVPPGRAAEETPAAIVNERDHRLCQVNAAAAARGLQVGMGLATAAVLCQEPQLLPYQETVEQQRLEALSQSLYDLCGDLSPDPPCGIWAGVTRMTKYHNGLNNYFKRLSRCIDTFQLHWQWGSGLTPLSAKLLAQSGQNLVSEAPDVLWSACEHTELRFTELSPSALKSLHQLGVRTLRDLMIIPVGELARRFEHEVVEYVLRLQGRAAHPLPFYRPVDRFHRSRELPYELTATQRLRPWIEQLLDELEQFLLARNQVALRLELQLHFRNQAPYSMSLGTTAGEARKVRWQPLVDLKLERQPLPAPVTCVTLSAQEVKACSAHSESLLARKTGHGMSAPQLVALLQARLGSERVRSPCRRDDFRPVVANVDALPLSPSSPALAPLPALRPAFLLQEPTVCREPLEIIQGPERIAAGWWDSAPQVRDYYIARNGKGQWCWVFREPDSTDWFLQGYFA